MKPRFKHNHQTSMEAHITSPPPPPPPPPPSSMDGKDSQQLQVVHLVSKAEAEKILYKFKDIPTSSIHNKKHINTVIKAKQRESKARNNKNDGEEEDLAQTNSLVFSCFHINSVSCKHLDIIEPMVVRVCPPFDQSIGATSSDALLPLIDRSSSLSSSSSSSSRSKLRSYSFSKSTAKLHHGIHLHSITDKVLRKFSKGASKCLAHQYRMRLHVATRRYRLKAMEAYT